MIPENLLRQGTAAVETRREGVDSGLVRCGPRPYYPCVLFSTVQVLCNARVIARSSRRGPGATRQTEYRVLAADRLAYRRVSMAPATLFHTLEPWCIDRR